MVFTHHGTRLVERVTPLLSELRSVFLEDNALRKGKIILGVSEAILASWGPRLFSQVRQRLPGVEFEFHAQRSPVVLDRLRSGEYMVGVCTGTPDADTDLVSEVIRLEPMVIIPSGLRRLDYNVGEPLSVITIESRSGAWASIDANVLASGGTAIPEVVTIRDAVDAVSAGGGAAGSGAGRLHRAVGLRGVDRQRPGFGAGTGLLLERG